MPGRLALSGSFSRSGQREGGAQADSPQMLSPATQGAGIYKLLTRDRKWDSPLLSPPSRSRLNGYPVRLQEQIRGGLPSPASASRPCGIPWWSPIPSLSMSDPA